MRNQIIWIIGWIQYLNFLLLLGFIGVVVFLYLIGKGWECYLNQERKRKERRMYHYGN